MRTLFILAFLLSSSWAGAQPLSCRLTTRSTGPNGTVTTAQIYCGDVFDESQYTADASQLNEGLSYEPDTSKGWLKLDLTCESAAVAASPLVGVWKLVKLEDFVGGQWVKSFGDHPAGYFAFAANGQASVQFAKDPPTAVDGYLAYFGTYEIDPTAGTFTVTVSGSLDPSLTGTKQVRPFKIVEGQLVVGDGVTYRRYFEKISNLPAAPNVETAGDLKKAD